MSYRPPRNLEPCGTDPAYRRHLRHGEEPCRPCRDAHATAGRHGLPRRSLIACGSPAAYKRHLRQPETPCQSCCDARAAEESGRRERRRQEARAAAAVKPPRLAAANAARAARHAERLEEYFWLRDGRVAAEDAAARVGVHAPPNVRQYESAYQQQREEAAA